MFILHLVVNRIHGMKVSSSGLNADAITIVGRLTDQYNIPRRQILVLHTAEHISAAIDISGFRIHIHERVQQQHGRSGYLGLHDLVM